MYLTTKGLVLRVSAYNDTDAMLTILTADQGRLSVKARGMRRKNSPVSAACQLLAYAEFTLFEYKGSFTLNEAHTIEIFSKLRNDLEMLSLGSYFAQAAEVIAQEDIPNPELLSLTLNCLYALSKLDVSIEKIKAVFELRCSCIAGYTPDLHSCHVCGCKTADSLDISEGRLECFSCRSYDNSGIRMPLTPGVLDAMRYICSCDSKKLLSFDLPQTALVQLAQITESFFSTQLERGFSALDFYKSLIFQSDHSE